MAVAPTTGSSKPAATQKPAKKEKVYHPQSRKASQLGRTQVRKSKLQDLKSKRGQRGSSAVDMYGFWYHAMPPGTETLTLEDMHSIVKDVWLTRHDEELAEERAARRKGRTKSVKESKLEEEVLRETELYRTGMEIPDLTHAPTVALFRNWDQKEIAFIHLLRFIRIFSTDKSLSLISRPGKHHSLLGVGAAADAPAVPVEEGSSKDVDAMMMDGDEAPMLMPVA